MLPQNILLRGANATKALLRPPSGPAGTHKLPKMKKFDFFNLMEKCLGGNFFFLIVASAEYIASRANATKALLRPTLRPAGTPQTPKMKKFDFSI